MCGRYTLHHDKNVLEEHFMVDFGPLLPRYNLAPAERIRFVFSNADERRQAGVARWGLVPHWSKTGSTETPLFNARSETVLQKPAFRTAFVRGRCLVPASGWYEWRRDLAVTHLPLSESKKRLAGARRELLFLVDGF